MGGKTWQQDEEELFWLELIPQSPEGLDPSQGRYSWKEIAEVMHERLGSKGYRNYNHQLIYEHFYQNCKSNHPSPRAKNFVREYMERRGDKPIERPKEPKSSKGKVVVKRRTASDDAGPSEPKRVRYGSQGAQESERTTRPQESPCSSVSLPARHSGDVAHAASQTSPYDGRTMNGYWSIGRHPLPFAPRPEYVPQVPHSVPSTSTDLDGRPSTSYQETLPSPSRNSVQEHSNARSFSDQDAPRPVSLPPLTPAPRIGSVGNDHHRTTGTRTVLPPISTLTAVADTGRPPRLPDLITPRHHGSKFEALLSAVSASSVETSPNSIFSHSNSFGLSRPDSPTSTLADDNAAEAENPDGPNAGKAVSVPAQAGDRPAMAE